MLEKEAMTTKPDDIDLKFKSSNVVPVDSARISVEEWESIKSTLTDAKVENGYLRARVAELESRLHISEEGTACANCHNPAHVFIEQERDQLRQQIKEAHEIIDSTINDLAIRAKLRSSRSGLAEDATLDISDGILQRAQEFLDSALKVK